MALPARKRWLLAALLALGPCLHPAPSRGEVLTDPNYWYRDIFSPFFAEQRLPDGQVLVRMRRPYSRGQTFLKEKPARTWRVFVLGGSIAYLYDREPGQCAGWTLAKVLERLVPGWRFEVVSCGMLAYDSYRDSLVLEEALRYQPDLVVLMTGNNDIGEGSGKPSWRVRAALRLRALLGIKSPDRGLVGKPEKPGATPLPVLISRFQGSLTEMTRLAKSRGVPVLLCTMPRQLGLAQFGPLPLEMPLFFDAWTRWERGDVPGAEAFLRRHLAKNPDERHGRLWLGRLAERRGDLKAAQAAYRPLADFWLNEAIRRVSRGEGAALAELTDSFPPPAGKARNEALFYDELHWNRFADPRVSLAIAEALARRPGFLPGAFARQEWERARRELAPAAPGPEEHAQLFLKRVGQAFWHLPKAAESFFFEEASLDLLDFVQRDYPEDLERLRGRKDIVLPQLLAGALPPASPTAQRLWARLLAHAGEDYRRRGLRRRALDCFRQALDLEPGLQAVQARQAMTLYASGRAAEGRRLLASLEAAAETLPEAAWYGPLERLPEWGDAEGLSPRARVHLKAALAWLQRKDLDQALAALAAADGEPGAPLSEGLPDFCAAHAKTCAPLKQALPELLRRLDGRPGPETSLRLAISRLAPKPETRAAPPPKDEPSDAEVRAALARFSRQDWAAGYRLMARATDGFSRNKLERFAGLCRQGRYDCAPWLDAQAQSKRLIDEGIRRFSEGSRGQAAGLFDEALLRNPLDANALVNRAVASSAAGEDGRALALYGRALATAAARSSTAVEAEMLSGRAAVLRRLGRQAQAREDLRRALRIAPQDWPRRPELLRALALPAGK